MKRENVNKLDELKSVLQESEDLSHKLDEVEGPEPLKEHVHLLVGVMMAAFGDDHQKSVGTNLIATHATRHIQKKLRDDVKKG
jgi:hypothetical protein